MNIFIPKTASPVERNAANELSVYLQKAYGYQFPILPEEESVPGIYVGFTQFAAQHNIHAQGGKNELNGAEAWVVCAVDNSLVITGGNNNMDRGIIYAAEHYLEDVVGVRFWNAMEEYVPELENFSIDPNLALCGEPEMIMRFAYTGSFVGQDPVFVVRHRANYTNSISLEWGGHVHPSKTGACHTVDRILPREGLYEQHPEWFAWNDAMQKHLPYGQYCLNNQHFIQVFEEAFLNDVAKRYAECEAEGTSMPYHFHISLDDSIYQCECPACKQSIARSGCTGNFLRFVNRIARSAKKKYADIMIEVLAYEHYIEPPLDDTLPDSNVAVRLANVHIDIAHSIHHPSNAHALELLKSWSAICKKNRLSFLYLGLQRNFCKHLHPQYPSHGR